MKRSIFHRAWYKVNTQNIYHFTYLSAICWVPTMHQVLDQMLQIHKFTNQCGFCPYRTHNQLPFSLRIVISDRCIIVTFTTWIIQEASLSPLSPLPLIWPPTLSTSQCTSLAFCLHLALGQVPCFYSFLFIPIFLVLHPTHSYIQQSLTQGSPRCVCWPELGQAWTGTQTLDCSHSGGWLRSRVGGCMRGWGRGCFPSLRVHLCTAGSRAGRDVWRLQGSRRAQQSRLESRTAPQVLQTWEEGKQLLPLGWDLLRSSSGLQAIVKGVSDHNWGAGRIHVSWDLEPSIRKRMQN